MISEVICTVVWQIVRGSWTWPTVKWTVMDVSGLHLDLVLSSFFYICPDIVQRVLKHMHVFTAHLFNAHNHVVLVFCAQLKQ